MCMVGTFKTVPALHTSVKKMLSSAVKNCKKAQAALLLPLLLYIARVKLHM